MTEQDNRVTLQDVRVTYDEMTDSLHLTFKDEDQIESSNFQMTMNNGAEYDVFLRELLIDKGLLEAEPFALPPKYNGISLAPASEWNKIPLGINRVGKEVFWEIQSLPQMSLSGITGAGKSEVEIGIINHCLKHDEYWKVCIIDPKKVEFKSFGNHADVTVATELKDAHQLVSEIHHEMMRRYDLMSAQGVNYFIDLRENVSAFMLVFDEANNFLGKNSAKTSDILEEELLHSIDQILLLGRAAGIHVVLCNQRVDENIINKDMQSRFHIKIHMGQATEDSSLMSLGNTRATTINSSVYGRGYVQSGHEGEEVQFFQASLQDRL